MRELRIVRNDDDGRLNARVEFGKERMHLLRVLRVEITRGLVGEQ